MVTRTRAKTRTGTAKRSRVKTRASRLDKYIYHVEAYYPVSQYPTKEAPIAKLAKVCGGIAEGGGMGMGKRGIGFLFKSKADASKFSTKLSINKIKH